MNIPSNNLHNQILYLRKKLKKYPKGELFCVKNGKYIKWYQSNHSTPIYIPKSQRPLAIALAEKKYYTYQLDSLLLMEKTIRQYEQIHQKIQRKTEQLLQEDSPYLELLKDHVFGMPAEFQDWVNADYPKNSMYPENLVHKTLAGHMVRSKSEALISNALFLKKIPYRYECMIDLGNIQLFPDFTLLHPQTGATLYWEHFGLMDDPAYCDKTFHKLKIYSLHGIIPSINLILTFETRQHPVDIESINKIIDEYFQ